ncbi:MAG: hypothetical protein ACM3SR_04395 [Ignavibacteriales bacterium]
MLWRTRHGRCTFINSGNVYRVITPIAVLRKWKPCIRCYSPIFELRGGQREYGFPVSPAPFASPPTEQELNLIREFDLERMREIEFLG